MHTEEQVTVMTNGEYCIQRNRARSLKRCEGCRDDIGARPHKERINKF